MEVYATPAAHALHVTNECPMPELVMMIQMKVPLVVVTLTMDVMHPSAMRREHTRAEWQITTKDVETTNEMVRVEVVIVEDAVNIFVDMVMEEATMETAMVEGMATPEALMPALTTSATVVLMMLLDLKLIQGM